MSENQFLDVIRIIYTALKIAIDLIEGLPQFTQIKADNISQQKS